MKPEYRQLAAYFKALDKDSLDPAEFRVQLEQINSLDPKNLAPKELQTLGQCLRVLKTIVCYHSVSSTSARSVTRLFRRS